MDNRQLKEFVVPYRIGWERQSEDGYCDFLEQWLLEHQEEIDASILACFTEEREFILSRSK